MLPDPLHPTELTNSEVKESFPHFYNLYSTLPRMLSKKRILAAVDQNEDINSNRVYIYKDLKFEIPPGVFEPSKTSEVIFDKLYDGTIQVSGARYLVMGAGAGVEAVIASKKDAKMIYALDIHRGSVEATKQIFRHLIPYGGSQLYVRESNLFENLPSGLHVDVITFNPPGVSIPISDNPDVVRVTSIGTTILTRFFYELQSKKVLDQNGEAFVMLTNSSELRKIISFALLNGLAPSILEVFFDKSRYQYYQTFLFKFTLMPDDWK